MRPARKLFLLFAMALAAMALTAGTANAQEEAVEVTNEVEHCDLGAANCEHHFVGSHSLALYFNDMFVQLISACNDEFLATLNEDGSGFIYGGDYENDAPTSQTCTRIQCNDTGEEDWPITNPGEYTGSQTEEGHFDMRICLDLESDPGGPGTHCDWELQIHNHGNHKYGFEADDVRCPLGAGIEVGIDGEWESEASLDEDETDIEIIH